MILKSASDKDTAEKFLKFLKEPSTIAIMQQLRIRASPRWQPDKLR